jgi:predicted nucleotidyltransferase
MAGAGIDWGSRDPLFGMSRDAFEQALKDSLRGRVEAAYFFGSYGTEAFGPGSDIDLILVSDTALPFTRRPAIFDDLYDLVPSLDLLVYTPREFEDLVADPSPGFWQSVAGGLRRLV